MNNEELTKTYFSNQHFVQSKEWCEFKTLMGTRATAVNGSQLTIHKIPFTPWKIGYCPKVRPEDLDLEKLYQTAKKEGCVFVKLDVPHAQREFRVSALSTGRQSSEFRVVEGKAVFAHSTILLDLTKSDDELLSQMQEKARYNINLARRKGIEVKINESSSGSTRRPLVEDAVGRFIELQKLTAERQRFFVHPDHYYRTCFETLSAHQMAYLLEAQVTSNNSQLTTNNTAASWMLFRQGNILYYPYGESNYEFRSYMPSSLLMWEAIQLGKKLGCKVFDLWGASENPEDKKDPWYGFTRFKLSFGGVHVKLAPTHDLVINPILYNIFNLGNNFRWKILKLVK